MNSTPSLTLPYRAGARRTSTARQWQRSSGPAFVSCLLVGLSGFEALEFRVCEFFLGLLGFEALGFRVCEFLLGGRGGGGAGLWVLEGFLRC